MKELLARLKSRPAIFSEMIAASLLANILQSIGAGIFTSAAGLFSSIIVARTLGVYGTASIAIALWIVFFAHGNS